MICGISALIKTRYIWILSAWMTYLEADSFTNANVITLGAIYRNLIANPKDPF